MNEIIEKALTWGIKNCITGPNGQGTKAAQVTKVLEEARETFDAVYWDENPDDVKDGIGDTVIALILLAEMHGWTLEECVRHSYNEIEHRTGEMIDGHFIRQKTAALTDAERIDLRRERIDELTADLRDELRDDDFDELLGPACRLDDPDCESRS